MKKIILAVAAAAALASPAAAADLGSRRQAVPEAVYMPAPPAGVWTGFYVGANLGAAFSSSFSNNANYSLGSASGFLVGLQAGYDHQIDRVVLGVAGDLNYATTSRSFINLNPAVDTRARQDWGGTLRLRAGYLLQDNVLVYVTGGLALGNVRVTDNLAVAPWAGSQSRTLTGWTLGAGGEYMFSRNWSAMLEYRYTGLSRAYYGNLFDQPSVGFASHTVRTGVNYRF